MAESLTQPLLSALHAYRPGRILQMGDLFSVQAGLSLYENLAVRWKGWNGAEQLVMMAEKAAVTVSADRNGQVLWMCASCGAGGCKHSVAVMATLAHAIRGRLGLTSKQFPPDSFDFLREALAMEPKAAGRSATVAERSTQHLPQVRIVQDGTGQLDAVCAAPRASLSLRGAGTFSSPSAITALPKPIRHLFSVPMVVPHELEEFLFKWTERHLGQFPVLIDAIEGDEDGSIATVVKEPLAGLILRRRRPESGSIDTEFTVLPLEVDSANGFCQLTDGPPIGNFCRLGRTLVYFPGTRALGRVIADEVWEEEDACDIDPYVRQKAFQHYRRTTERKPFKRVEPTRLSIADCNATPYPIDTETGWDLLVRYFEGDSETPFDPVPQRVQMHFDAEINPDSDEVMLLVRAWAHTDVSRFFDDVCDRVEAAEEFIRASPSSKVTAFEDWRMAAGRFLCAKTPGQRKAIVDAFLDKLAAEKRTSRVFHLYHSGFKALAEFLGNTDAEIVIATDPDAGAAVPPWVRIAKSADPLAALGACYCHFPGLNHQLAEEPGSTGAMTRLVVNGRQWKSGLAAFCAECVRLGIELRIDGKPLQTVSLAFEIKAEPVTEAEPGTGAAAALPHPDDDRIDWFELHPRIFCGDRDIPEEQWTSILLGGTFEAGGADGAIHVVDAESLERFALFLRAGAGAGGRSGKSDDGAAVKVPRLQILDWIHLKEAGIDVVLPEEDAAIVESLLAGTPGEPAALPEAVQATLRPYQLAGYRWLAFLYEHRFGAVLADDMGLGKTLQTITLLAGLDAGVVRHRPRDRHPHLAVLPPSLLFNWRSEIERFLPGLQVYEYTGQRRSLDDLRKADIALTTYELARRDIDKLEQEKFDVIIFDEAQAAKNLSAARSKAIRRLRARFRICLTGTPLENHVGEYFAILDLALPGLIGEGEDHRKALRATAGTGTGTGSTRYLRRAQPFVLRRTKETVLKDLPPKIESDIFLDLDRSQREFYTRTVAEVRDEVARAFAHKPKQQAGIVALAALMRLRQICVAPGVIDPSLKDSAAPKLDHLVEKLCELREEGHSALVFSQFTRVLDLVEPRLTTAGLSFLRLDGQTPQKLRKQRVEQFQSADDASVFLISLKAGGAGLNLTRASYVFHLDPWWNPAVERQASDRAHRIGQKNTVFIHRILMRDTVEEKMMVLKARKQELYDEIMGSAEAEGERIQSRKAPMITQEDIGFLLGR